MLKEGRKGGGRDQIPFSSHIIKHDFQGQIYDTARVAIPCSQEGTCEQGQNDEILVNSNLAISLTLTEQKAQKQL